MADNLNNDNELDRWLRQNAGAEEATPANDGWDTPSPQVWASVRAGLDRRKKRRRGILFFVIILLAVLGSLGIRTHRPNTVKQPVADMAPDRPFESNTPAATPAPTPAPVDYARAANPAIHTKTPTVAGHDLPEHPATPQKNSPDASRESQTIQMPAAAPALLPEDPQTTTTAKHDMPDTRNFIAFRYPEIGQLPTLPPPRLSRVREVEFTAAGSNVVPPKDHKLRGWYAGATTGTLFTTRHLKTPAGLAADTREYGAWTQQYGSILGFRLNRRWSLETGLQWTAIHLRAVRRVNFRYRANNEQFDAQNFVYRNSDNQTVETSFGRIDMRMDIGREPSRPIQDQTIVQLTLTTDEQVNYARIPLTLRWQTDNARWRWSLAGGIGLNIESGYDLNINAARANRPGVRNINARLQGRASGLAPLAVDAQLGAGFDYRIAPKVWLRLAPEVRYGLSPMYQKGPFRSTALAGGVQFGILLNLK